MVDQISLRQLQKQITIERKKAKTIEEKRELERELKRLREGKSTKVLKRFGRGFVILSKKGAKAIGKGAIAIDKFGRERGAGEFFETEFSTPSKQIQRRRVIVRAKPRAKIIITKKAIATRKVFVPGLGIVTQRIQPQRTIRKIIRKAKRRKTTRIRKTQDDPGFFGGLSDLGVGI